MTKHRTHSIGLERQVWAEYLAAETLHGVAKGPDVTRFGSVWTSSGQARSMAT